MLAICLSMLESPEDRESFAALYEGCKGRAFYLARRIVGRDDLAEDAVQEGFVYLAQHYRRLKHSGKQNLEGYLFDCVESRAVDLLRRSGRESEEEADFPPWKAKRRMWSAGWWLRSSWKQPLRPSTPWKRSTG